MNSISNEVLLTIAILLSVLYITCFFLNNVLKYKAGFTHAFIFFLFTIRIISIVLNIYSLEYDPLLIYFIMMVIFLIVSVIANRKNIIFVNHKYLLLSLVIGIAMLVFAMNYCTTISLSSNTNSIQYLGYFSNNDLNIYFYTFFNYFLELFSIKKLEVLNSFIIITTFLFYFLLADFILYYKKDNNKYLIPLLSYFAFFVSFLCLKFNYVAYIWLVFPINLSMIYISKKNLGIFDSLFLAISLFSLLFFFEDEIMSLLLMGIIIMVLDITGTINDNKYKYFLISFLLMRIYFYQQNLTIYLSLIVLLLICVLIQIINIRKYFTPFFILSIIVLFINSLYKFINKGYSLNIINNGLLSIQFIGDNNRLFFITLFYCIMLLICLLSFKKSKKTIYTVLTICFIIFNPMLIYECNNSFATINPLLYVLFNPSIIVMIYSSAAKVLYRYNLNNSLSLALLILSFYCTSNTLYPNIYEKDYLYFDKSKEYNQQYRMEEDELDIYKFMMENDVEITGNMVSQAPNTIAYIKDVNLLNDYYYYIDLLNNKELEKAPNNLTNIFAIRKFNNIRYFEEDPNYEDSKKELTKQHYDYLLLRKDQYILDDLELIYLFYKDNGYKIIYENSTYALLRVKGENDL